MDLHLRDVVVRALDALSVKYSRIPGGGLEVRIPANYRARFRDRPLLRVVFDEEYWQHDREAELVTVGSPFLNTLEDALRNSGTVSIAVGGEWTLDPQRLEDWRNTFIVLNGHQISTRDGVHTETTIRITYEVSVPGALEQTELVPVGWNKKQGVIEPAALGRLVSSRWYTPEEVGGIGAEAVEPELLEEARAACARELEIRLRPLVSEERAGRRVELGHEEEQVRREAEAGREQAGKDGVRVREIAEEERERLQRIQKAKDATWRAAERAIQVWRVARLDVGLIFARTGDDLQLSVPLLRTTAGRLRSDLCASCTQSNTRYFLAPNQLPTRLLCEGCAILCAGHACIELVARRGKPSCALCTEPRHCEIHTPPCSVCGQMRCAEHARAAACCGAWLCRQDQPADARDGRLLCGLHSARCAVDGQWTHLDDVVTCPITKRILFRGNAVVPPGDDRLLDPRAVVRCASDHAPLARDRAGQCAVDDQWYRLADLVTCPITGRVLFRGNAVVPPGDGRLLDPDAVVRGGLDGAPLARDRAGKCAVDDQWYSLEDLVTCPITGRTLYRPHAIRPPGDDRLLDPMAVVRCASNGALLALDRAGKCPVDDKWYRLDDFVTCPITARVLFRGNSVAPPDDGRLLDPDAVVQCHSTNAPVARDRARQCAVDEQWHRADRLVLVHGEPLCAVHMVVVDVPEGRIVRSDRVVICRETHAKLAPEAAGECSVRRALYDSQLLVLCPLTKKWLHRGEAVQPPGDDRALHPAAVVRCSATHVWVARDRAVLNELAEADRWLAPEAAVRCAVSQKVTASNQTVVAACCNRRVASKFAGKSPISNQWWCTDHRKRCDWHGDFVLPNESVRCAITGVQLCTQHTVESECRRRVATDQAYLLPSGTHGCTDHYTSCAGGHPMLHADAKGCVECGVKICTDHSSTDLYDPKSARCSRHLRECVRCGFLAAHREGPVCRWCEDREPIGARAGAMKRFDASIRPRLPWSFRFIGGAIQVSGTERVQVFEVGGLLGNTLFRIADGVLEKQDGPHSWVLA